MKRILIGLVSACVSLAALATEFVWTGAGDGGSWSDPNNWDKKSGYPSDAADVAMFSNKKSNTVTLDVVGATSVSSIRVKETGTEVVVNGVEGASFDIPTGSLYTLKGVLEVNVPISVNGRWDFTPEGYGTITVTKPIVNAGTATSYYSYSGDVYLKGDAAYTAIASGAVFSFGNSSAANQSQRLFLTENAEFHVAASGWKVSKDIRQPGLEIQQDGPDTTFTVDGDFGLGYDPSTADLPLNPEEFGARYWLKNGAFSVGGTLQLGRSLVAKFVQDGGTASIGVLDMKWGDIELNGGEMSIGTLKTAQIARHPSTVKATGGTLAIGTLTVANDTRFAFSDCTLSLETDTTIAQPLNLGGEAVTIDVAAGKTVTITVDPEFAAGTKLVKTGAGDLQFNCDMRIRGDLEIREGKVWLRGQRVYQNDVGDDTWRKVTVHEGAALYIYGAYVHLTAPCEYHILKSDKGCGFVRVESDRSDGGKFALYAKRFYVNETPLAKGNYTTSNTDVVGTSPSSGKPFVCSGTASLIIPHIWTGKGGDNLWDTAANWEDDEIPPSTRACYAADLSAATVVDLGKACRQTGCGIYFSSMSGARTLRIVKQNANGIYRTMASTNPNSSTDNATGGYIGEGSTVVFDGAEYRREGGRFVSLGGGTLLYRGNGCFAADSRYAAVGNFDPANEKNVSGFIAMDGDIRFLAMTNDLSSGNHPLIFHCWKSEASGSVFFGRGVDLSLKNILYTDANNSWATGGPDGIFQRDDAVLAADGLYMMTVDNTWQPRHDATYYLESGSLTLRTGLFLGSVFNSDWNRYSGGNFRMSGGTLRTNQIASENNQNWCYLEGGDVYVGAGGIVKTADSTNLKTYTANATPSLQLGGVVVHATADFSVSLDTLLTGAGAGTTLDTAGHAVTFANCALSGRGRLTKTGLGNLKLDGVNDFAGVIDVAGGTLEIGEDATFTKKPNLALASDGSLALPAGAEVEVASLTVGGTRKTGRVDIGGGTVVVSPDDCTWIGASGGKWSVASNWANGVVPNGAAVAVDFSASGIDGDYTIVLDQPVELASVAFAGMTPGTVLTLKAESEAATLTLNAGSSIQVSEGSSLVLDATYVVNGRNEVRGGGTVDFAGDVVKGAGNSYIFIYEGSTAIFRGSVSTSVEVRLYNEKAYADAGKWAKLVVEDGADFASLHWPVHSASNRGAIVEIKGGVMRFTGACDIGTGENNREKVVLSGGVLRLSNACTFGEKAEWKIKGGTIEFGNDGRYFAPANAVEVEGATFKGTGSAQAVVLTSAVVGTGAVSFGGNARFSLLSEVEGVFDLQLDDTASVSFVDDVLTLNSLKVGARTIYKGLYDTSFPRLGGRFVGTGKINVLTGDKPGMLLFVR